MSELQDKLEQLETEIAGHKNAQSTLDGCITAKRKQVDAIKKQIAEEAKPKLRHGDYDKTHIYLESASWLKGTNDYDDVCATSNGLILNLDGKGEMGVILGNIFDDLTAMQENVTEFEMSDGDVIAPRTITAEIDPDKRVWVQFKDENGTAKACRFTDATLSTLILKLRQIEATLNRKKVSE